ncbi:MAG: HAMP domain-containing sensor histidine kinase [Micromonosporaceae bacterium]
MLRRLSLRTKLVATVVVLVIAAETGFGVATTVLMRDHLLDELDRELTETVERLSVTGFPNPSLPSVGQADPPTVSQPLPSDYLVYVTSPAAQGFGVYEFLWYYDRYTEQNLPRLPRDLGEALRLSGEPVSVPAQDRSSRWRMIVTLLPTAGAQPGQPLRQDQVIMLVVAQNMAGVDAALNQLIWTEVLVGAAVLGLVVVLGATGVRRSLRPLLQMQRTAQAITGGDLSRRVPEPEGDRPRTELGRLARALNTMLEQIESAFAARARSEAAAREAEARARQSEERMRQFVADASHELRTPLTSIRGFAELYRQGAVSSPEDTAALLGRIENEAARMGLLVEDLLLLARLDQQRPLDDEPVELAVVVSDSVEAARAVEPERPITVELPDGTARLVVRGDDARLRQVVGNLLSNALTHTPPGTPVSVRLYAENGLAVVEVADKGPGLAPEQAERVFERFYRADAARGRPARRAGAASMGGGTGLGLAIVAAITEAHGGSVQLDTEPGRGATFRVRLPLADREFVTMDREQQPRAERGDDGE